MKVWKMLWLVSEDRKEKFIQIHSNILHAVTHQSCDQIVCACHRGVASGAAHTFVHWSGWMRTHHWMQGGSGLWSWYEAPPLLITITIIILRELLQPVNSVWTETSKTSGCSALLPVQIHLRFSFRRSRVFSKDQHSQRNWSNWYQALNRNHIEQHEEHRWGCRRTHYVLLTVAQTNHLGQQKHVKRASHLHPVRPATRCPSWTNNTMS